MTSRIEKGIEAIASEAMGAMKATKAKVAGLTGVFAHLAREHGKVTGLLLRLKASSDPELRSELFPKIRKELLSHEKGELAEVFPVLAEHSELAPFVEEHRRDADKLEARIDELSKTGYAEARWSKRLADLIENVSKHALEEENDFFPEASRVLGDKKTEQMLERFEAAKTRIAKTIGAPAPARKASSTPTRPRAITARAAQTANRVARQKKAAAPSRAKAKRSGAKPRKTKAAASKKTAR
jgi:hemerythrin superfamily protein